MDRVLHVVSSLERGGTEAFIMNNFRTIDRNEIQFDFFVFVEKEYPYTEEITRLGGKIFWGEIPSAKNAGSLMKRLGDVIRQNGPYVAIHSHVNIANSWVMKAAKKAGVKVRISHSHAISDNSGSFIKKLYKKFQLHLLKRNATHFFACSREAGQSLYGKNFFDFHGEIIKNGINIKDFVNVSDQAVANLKQELGCNDAELVLGNVTRFDLNKNQLFILDIFKDLLKYKPGAVLLLGGVDGGMLDAVKSKAKEMQILNNIRFIGPRKDIPVCLKLIDVYLFTSFSEGLGIALLEAQAGGCMCFVSTGVVRKADVGLGNVHFESLQTPPSIWAKKIIDKYAEYKAPDESKVEYLFKEKGYLIQETTDKLSAIYQGKVR